MSLTFWDTDFEPSWPDRWFNEHDWRLSRPFGDWERPSQLMRRRGTEFGGGALRPRMDLHENPENNTMTALFELPGLAKENVNISVHNGRLEVSGESKLAQEYETGGYAMRERQMGRFHRSINLPTGVTENDITAKLDNGVLTVTYPKISAEMAPKKIAIQ